MTTQACVDQIVQLLLSDDRLNAKPWDRYTYFMYVGEGVVSSSGFRFVGRDWYSGSTNCHGRIEGVMEILRNEDDPADDGPWNAAAIALDKSAAVGNLHLFHGLSAEAWDMTPDNQRDIADRALRLFGNGGIASTSELRPLTSNQTGIKGKTARLLTSAPRELPPDTSDVVILDDKPSPDLVVRVFVPGIEAVGYIPHDQLAVHE